MKREIGLYYVRENDLVIVGYRNDDNSITGRVIANLNENPMFQAFHVGYKYKHWRGTYIGRINSFSNLKGYMDFLIPATDGQITAYFKAKKAVERYLNSYVRPHGTVKGIRVRHYVL